MPLAATPAENHCSHVVGHGLPAMSATHEAQELTDDTRLEYCADRHAGFNAAAALAARQQDDRRAEHDSQQPHEQPVPHRFHNARNSGV